MITNLIITNNEIQFPSKDKVFTQNTTISIRKMYSMMREKAGRRRRIRFLPILKDATIVQALLSQVSSRKRRMQMRPRKNVIRNNTMATDDA